VKSKGERLRKKSNWYRDPPGLPGKKNRRGERGYKLPVCRKKGWGQGGSEKELGLVIPDKKGFDKIRRRARAKKEKRKAGGKKKGNGMWGTRGSLFNRSNWKGE